MRRVWFVSNVRSGTATAEKCAAIEAVVGERGLTLAGRTRFPHDALPDSASLDMASVDTLLLFAGDGTVNAALGKLADWNGAVLVLPGGTMNLLARRLHATLDPHAIIADAHAHGRRTALPYVEAGDHRAFVGLIIGPVTAWARAREAARERRFAQAARAIARAWRRTFGHGVRLDGAPRLRRRYQAMLVTPQENGLALAGIDARDWRSLADLGWRWLTGEWLAAHAVETSHVRELRVPAARPLGCLFDGEPETLAPATRITCGRTADVFLSTAPSAKTARPAASGRPDHE